MEWITPEQVRLLRLMNDDNPTTLPPAYELMTPDESGQLVLSVGALNTTSPVVRDLVAAVDTLRGIKGGRAQKKERTDSRRQQVIQACQALAVPLGCEPGRVPVKHIQRWLLRQCGVEASRKTVEKWRRELCCHP